MLCKCRNRPAGSVSVGHDVADTPLLEFLGGKLNDFVGIEGWSVLVQGIENRNLAALVEMFVTDRDGEAIAAGAAGRVREGKLRNAWEGEACIYLVHRFLDYRALQEGGRQLAERAAEFCVGSSRIILVRAVDDRLREFWVKGPGVGLHDQHPRITLGPVMPLMHPVHDAFHRARRTG
jgi:hypothetical protein